MWPAVRTEGELGRGVGAGAEQERKPGRERMLVRTGTGERRKRLGRPTGLLGWFWVERRFWAELMRARAGWVG